MYITYLHCITFLFVYRRSHLCATKILCYTRQSPLISNIPLLYPSTMVTEHKKLFLEDIICNDLDSLMLIKVTPVMLEGELERIIQQFMKSINYKVMLIIANMHDITTKMVNHLRILVEQNEPIDNGKLVVFLLHFPPATFFSTCYPALFLSGWDHFYLDAISTKLDLPEGLPQALSNIVDIKRCFQKCLHVSENTTDNAFSLRLQPLFKEAIPVISPRINIGDSNTSMGWLYNSKMPVAHRQVLLRKLFETEIGKSFVHLFCHYWDETTMAEFLEDASRFVFQQQSTLSITSYVQTKIKTLFFEFLIYMLHQINEDCNLDTMGQILNENWKCNNSVEMLFCCVIRTFTTRLSNLVAVSLNNPICAPRNTGFQFPFFRMIHHTLEEIVDGCREETNVRSTAISSRSTLQTVENSMFKAMKKKLEKLHEVLMHNFNVPMQYPCLTNLGQ